MRGGTLRLAGISGLAWGLLALALWITNFLMPGRSSIILDLLGLLALAALVAMLYLLSVAFAEQTGKFACYAAIAFAAALTVLPIVGGEGRTLVIALRVLFGLGLLGVGLGAFLQGGALPWKAFAILLIAAGALRAAYGELIYPILACAAGIALFVATGAGRTRAT